MSISLKQAYSACLWLAERKLGIPSTEQRGNWDLTKEGDLAFSRKDLVTSLPNEYFDELSCYTGRINNENDDEFNGLFFIDASNFIDGQLFKFEDQDYFQYFSPFRKSSFFIQNGDENLDLDLTPDNIQQIQELSLLTLNELNHDSCSTENKPRLAEITAHLALSEKLLNKAFIAKGYRQDIQHKDYLEDKFAECLIETIPIETWKNKTIPNYAESALELGQLRFKELFAQCANGFHKNDPREDYLSKCECWYSHIIIENEQDFTNWIVSEVRELFPTPKHATFKPQGKGYIIQFGTDKLVEVKRNKGLNIILKLLKGYKTPIFKDDFGYSLETIHYDIIEDEINDYEISTKSQRDNNDNIIKYIRKQQNLIFWQLEKLKDHEDEIREECFYNKGNKNEINIENIKSSILSRFNKINSIKNTQTINIDKETIQRLINCDPDIFFQHKDKIKSSLNIELSSKEKSTDNIRKNIDSAIKILRKETPHFASFLDSPKSKATSGIGYNNDLFYIICSNDIQWDFG
ncbi:hypothetical protein [Photobacterium leiognathi]|uniref:hypothetical protein n=1 Tax=Photobacterium leiognathi TaxID=553611 RepID=UPI0027399194|nr:hypothetical protein [Photobacterium leiognathi]